MDFALYSGGANWADEHDGGRSPASGYGASAFSIVREEMVILRKLGPWVRMRRLGDLWFPGLKGETWGTRHPHPAPGGVIWGG